MERSMSHYLPVDMTESRDERIHCDGGSVMRLIFKLLSMIVAGIVCGIVSWVIGAYIGGNYAVDFTFNGVRGYEAMGQLGFFIGLIGGGILFWVIVFKPLKKE